MTNFEAIKNMDIDTLAMMIAMDRQRTVNDVFELLKLNRRVKSDFTIKEFESIKKHLATERDSNV